MNARFTAIGLACLSGLAAGVAPLLARGANVGEHYVVDGRCVTVTQIVGSQASYEWSAGNASGNGDLPAGELTQRCTPRQAAESAPAAEAAPASRVPAAAAPRPNLPANDRFALTTTEAQSMLAAHNAVRAEVGVGPLSWDAAAADFAQRYVSTLATVCDLRHSTRSGYGENLAAWGGDAPPNRAVAMWAEEKSSYRGGGGPFSNADMVAGHYTQVVWRATTGVGCGRTRCSKDGFNWTLVSCNYSPPGNMLGARTY